ncbi:hypothetical protein MJG53_015095 [Ovis ammon polii x Ovis aries]|uniref:Uncharacterized protein n=1 Tax=Ovis ammon polii x Ovis aries TaxID=2918886 RepID=A0ACB9UE86_9CETA|nr:hypothetical protein MJG53_015095 [Ovis ammon polii x Ovis aries]
MDPSAGAAAGEGPPAPRPRRRRSLRRLFGRFLLALGSRSRPGDSPPRARPQPQSGHGDGDGEGGFEGPDPAAPGSPGEERPPGPQPQLPAGDGARPPGAQGLKNHGNTCFMNAVVQCLSNTDLLAEFLALGRYRAEPGRAEVTEQLAALVRALWTREYTPQLSAEFKNAVSKYGAQFQGNAQHDALEFLLWLLDRVHEDLEGSSRGPGSDKLQSEARKASENLRSPSAPLSVGQSFVQSHFQAQYRSSLTCPHCLKQSNTFDPFLCVSLPIPLRQTRFLSVTLVFPSKSQRFLRVGLAVPILSTVAALRKMVAEEGGVSPEEGTELDLGAARTLKTVVTHLLHYKTSLFRSPQCSMKIFSMALHLRRPGGPPHIKLAVEWDVDTKERLFGNPQEERVQDADSVRRQQQAHQQHSCTLDECFQFYTKEEQLAQDDAWRCPHCKALQQGVVKLSLWTLPDILIIHLKRFCQVGERRNKLSTLVKFPLAGLDMAPHVAQRSTSPKAMPGAWPPSWKQPACLPTSYPPDFLYDLYAVCNHHGSLQAYCRNSLDGQWYSYDDSTVEPLLEDEVNTRGAYILFYQKRNSIPPWSASSSMRGSTSSSLSDHWLLRLGSSNGSTRGSLLSWSSAPGPARPRLPESAFCTNSLPRQEKGGLESRPLARGIQGRSISMKVPTPSRAKQGAFKTMPLRWSFGPREKPPGTSVELVEYLESRRRPRSTSQSIVQLLTGPAGGHQKSHATLSVESEDSRRTSNTVLATAPCPSGHPDHCVVPGNSDGPNAARKLKENSSQDIRLPKQFDLPLTVMSSTEDDGRRPRPEGQRTTSCKGSGLTGSSGQAPSPKEGPSAATLPRKSADSRSNSSGKMRANGERRDPETDRFPQGTLTLLRSVFWKKEIRKRDRPEASPQVAPVSLVSGRRSPAVDGEARGSSPSLRIRESLARGPAGHLERERDVRSAPSSLLLPRKTGRPPRASALGTSQRSVPGEQTSFGTLPKVKYHTLSLRRKKSLPESSF